MTRLHAMLCAACLSAALLTGCGAGEPAALRKCGADFFALRAESRRVFFAARRGLFFKKRISHVRNLVSPLRGGRFWCFCAIVLTPRALLH